MFKLYCVICLVFAAQTSFAGDQMNTPIHPEVRAEMDRRRPFIDLADQMVLNGIKAFSKVDAKNPSHVSQGLMHLRAVTIGAAAYLDKHAPAFERSLSVSMDDEMPLYEQYRFNRNLHTIADAIEDVFPWSIHENSLSAEKSTAIVRIAAICFKKCEDSMKELSALISMRALPLIKIAMDAKDVSSFPTLMNSYFDRINVDRNMDGQLGHQSAKLVEFVASLPSVAASRDASRILYRQHLACREMFARLY